MSLFIYRRNSGSSTADPKLQDDRCSFTLERFNLKRNRVSSILLIPFLFSPLLFFYILFSFHFFSLSYRTFLGSCVGTNTVDVVMVVMMVVIVWNLRKLFQSTHQPITVVKETCKSVIGVCNIMLDG